MSDFYRSPYNLYISAILLRDVASCKEKGAIYYLIFRDLSWNSSDSYRSPYYLYISAILLRDVASSKDNGSIYYLIFRDL